MIYWLLFGNLGHFLPLIYEFIIKFSLFVYVLILEDTTL